MQERLAKKNHKTRPGIELISSDDLSNSLPLNYPTFSPSSPQVAKEKITQTHRCYLLKFNSQNRVKLFFHWKFVGVMNYSNVHMSTQVIDDQSLSCSRHMAWCGCHEILIQRGTTVLFFANFSLHSIPL